MSSLVIARIACIGALVSGAIGVIAGIFSKRFPMRGWAASLFLGLCVALFVLIEPADQQKSSRWTLLYLFTMLTPCAVLYGWFAFRRATDRLAAVAALVGAITMGALLLFTIAGTVMFLIETFTSRP